MIIDIFFKAFLVTISLIMAIGAQNAYVLKLGLLKQHAIKAALMCIFFDFILIASGVYGLGFFINGNQILINSIAYFGIAFLCFYALTSFKAALKNESMKIDNDVKTKPLKEVVTLILVFTFLNPHTYLDTILLIGGIGANVENDLKVYFLLGAMSASATWFLTLAYGARFLIPMFKNPLTWKILDILIGILMLFIAYSLIDLIK